MAARAANADQAAASKEATGKYSQFYGVVFDTRACRWKAAVWHGGTRHIGYFDDEVAAARAVDEWLLANGRRRVNLDDDGQPLEQQSTYASIYVGVYKNGGSWLARIRVNNKSENLGTFVTQREAALARDERARQLGRGTNLDWTARAASW